MNIDAALVALCRTHDLTSLACGITMPLASESYRFTAYAHWGRDEEYQCRQGNGATYSAAIADAISKANAARFVTASVPAIEMDVAA